MVLSKTLHFADPALYDVSGEQKWIRGTANSEGYFTLQNPTSGKFLTAASPTSTTISGTFRVAKVVTVHDDLLTQ